MAEKAKMKTKTIDLTDPNLSAMAELTLKIEGLSPLIMNKFSEKAKEIMKGAQSGKATGKKAPKNFEQCYLESIHIIGRRSKTVEGLSKCRFGFPAVAFKSSAIRAAKLSNEANMTDARAMFHVAADHDDLVELKTDGPEYREDPVRIQKTADIRPRAMFREWTATLHISYNARLVTAERLTSWFVHAGFAVGVGEWRPCGKESTGTYGTYRVTSAVAMVPDIDNLATEAGPATKPPTKPPAKAKKKPARTVREPVIASSDRKMRKAQRAGTGE